MTWVQAHPPGTTSVASSKTQFQQNNLYIENTLQADHYFDDATASNDGHHKFVQLPIQGADPAVAIAGGGCIYLKAAAFNDSPFIQIEGKVFQIPIALNLGTYVCNSGYTNTFNFAGYPRIRGMVYAFNQGSPRKAIASTFVWNGTVFYVNERNAGKGQLTADGDDHLKQFYSDGSTFLQVRTDATITVNISIWGHIN